MLGEALVRAVGVEVVRVFVEHCHVVLFVVEQESVGAFFADEEPEGGRAVAEVPQEGTGGWANAAPSC